MVDEFHFSMLAGER